jgi:hypothetical protein
MVPLKIFQDGRVHELSTKDFSEGIIELCEKHRNEGRALAFAFLLYDFQNPQIIKVLEDRDYWNALNATSGKYLSIYYIHTKERFFAEDLNASNGVEKRGMHPISGGVDIDNIVPILKRYLALETNVKMPSILFFQVEGALISDYFLIELFEETIEKSFIELKDYILEAVASLKRIDPTCYENYQPIFECLKREVKSKRFRKVSFGNVQKFPVQLLINWFLGNIKIR